MASNDNTIKHVNGRLADADVKAKVADALRQEADMAAIAEQMRAAKEQNDQKRLQLLVARIEKAIGKNVEQRVLVGALVILVVKTFQFAPKHKHSQMFVNFMNVVSSMLSITKVPTDAPGQDNGQQDGIREAAENGDPNASRFLRGEADGGTGGVKPPPKKPTQV